MFGLWPLRLFKILKIEPECCAKWIKDDFTHHRAPFIQHVLYVWTKLQSSTYNVKKNLYKQLEMTRLASYRASNRKSQTVPNVCAHCRWLQTLRQMSNSGTLTVGTTFHDNWVDDAWVRSFVDNLPHVVENINRTFCLLKVLTLLTDGWYKIPPALVRIRMLSNYPEYLCKGQDLALPNNSENRHLLWRYPKPRCPLVYQIHYFKKSKCRTVLFKTCPKGWCVFILCRLLFVSFLSFTALR